MTSVQSTDPPRNIEEDVDPDYDPAEDTAGNNRSARPSDAPKQPSMVRFGERLVSAESVQKAVDYFGRFKTKRPSLSSVSSRFRFIKTESHLRKLREFARNGTKIDVNSCYRFIGQQLRVRVVGELGEGKPLNDADVRRIVGEIIDEHRMDMSFSPSDSWINSWKRANRISFKTKT